MRKIISVFVVLFLFALPFSPAFAAEQAYAREGLDLNLGAGYRVDQLRWNIAGDMSGSNPNILSELTWSDLEMFAVKATLKSSTPGNIFYRASVEYGTIYAGENQDSDYLGDDRTIEFSRSNNSADSGSALDLSAGAGYVFRSGGEETGAREFIPMLGFSYHRQALKITDGFQTIPATGPFGGLDSAYTARWIGPWIGFEANFYGEVLSLLTSLEYHFLADYHAEADWNLRTDFQHPVSFEHFADGSGVVFSLDALYRLGEPLYLSAVLEGQAWKADEGIDRTYFSSGSIIDTRLNEVVWSSLAFLFGAQYRF